MGYAHGVQWSEERILDAIKTMVDSLNISTMPTFAQMNDFFGDTRLSNAISKHKKSKYYAEILGLDIKKCETELGNQYEEICANFIEENLGMTCELTSVRFPYDILADRSVKIDVKVGRVFDNYGNSKYFTFNLEKKNQTCDIFVCYCIGSRGELTKTLVIPSYVLSGKKQLSIGVYNSRYDQYVDRWDILEKYRDFIKSTV